MFAECDTGFFGSDCNHECSKTCKIPRKCNHITGACEDGCQPGWQGLECGIELNGGNRGLFDICLGNAVTNA